MRRLIALALVAVLAAGVSACGKSEEQKQAEKSNEFVKRMNGTYKKQQ